MSQPEPWLRGAVPGYIAELQPFVHALLLAREELARILEKLEDDVVWQSPGNAAPIAYHVRHFAGTTTRMLTYMRGEALTEQQWAQKEAEHHPEPLLGSRELLEMANAAIEAAMTVARDTTQDQLDEPRAVGRKQLPTTVRGLFYEIALHTARHVGQIATTARVLA